MVFYIRDVLSVVHRANGLRNSINGPYRSLVAVRLCGRIKMFGVFFHKIPLTDQSETLNIESAFIPEITYVILQIKIGANGHEILNDIRVAIFTPRVYTGFAQLCK